MAEEQNGKTVNDNPEPENGNPNQVPPIVINNQYIKDLSLEIPHAPEIFRNLNENPDVNIDVNVNANHMHDNFFNVSLLIKMNGVISGRPFFILELEYAGVVSINVPQEHLEPVLLIEIPRLFFPYARNIVTNTLVNGGLPPLMLNPIDFAAMYQHRKQTSDQPK